MKQNDIVMRENADDPLNKCLNNIRHLSSKIQKQTNDDIRIKGLSHNDKRCDKVRVKGDQEQKRVFNICSDGIP